MTREELVMALEPLVRQLTRIADLLMLIASSSEALSEPDPTDTTCPHPEDLRISFGMTNGQPDWLCSVCQYRSIPS